MNEQPAFTNHIATFGNIQIQFQRDREGDTKDIINAWLVDKDDTFTCCFSSLQLILTALNSDFPELVSNCKDITNL